MLLCPLIYVYVQYGVIEVVSRHPFLLLQVDDPKELFA